MVSQRGQQWKREGDGDFLLTETKNVSKSVDQLTFDGGFFHLEKDIYSNAIGYTSELL